MTKRVTTESLDPTAIRLGAAMRTARRICHLSRDEVSGLLRVPTAELAEYERGAVKVPHDILIRTFIMGYKMMRVRTLENRYRLQRQMFRKLKETIASIP